MPSRTEREKMLAGESYNCLDPDLQAERQKTKELLRLYNLTQAVPERQIILQQLLGQIGHNSIIEPPFYCSYGQNIHIGDFVYLNVLCTILDCADSSQKPPNPACTRPAYRSLISGAMRPAPFISPLRS